ncbi:MAG: hypothetical protein RL026_82 [Pseudomonadota bacterium]|jgi:AraC-like DNA-binding protein
MMERYATAPGPAVDRLRRWCAFGSTTLSPLVVRPQDPASFQASLARARLGDLGVGEMRTTPAQAHGLGSLRGTWASAGGGSLILSLQKRGSLRCRQAGREVALSPGDVVLWDLRREWEQLAGPDTLIIWCKLPALRLQQCLGNPEDLLALPLRAGSPETQLLGSVIESTARLAFSGSPGAAPEAALDLVCDALKVACLGRDGRSADDIDLRQAAALRRQVDQRLADPTLTVAGLARELGLSLRSFQRSFQANGTSARSYILEQRLQRAAAELRRAGVRGGQRITAVALACGFNDPAYFSRAFQQRFGLPPREYLQRTPRDN